MYIRHAIIHLPKVTTLVTFGVVAFSNYYYFEGVDVSSDPTKKKEMLIVLNKNVKESVIFLSIDLEMKMGNDKTLEYGIQFVVSPLYCMYMYLHSIVCITIVS